MNLDWRTTAVVAGVLLATGSAGSAAVFDERSPEQKLRADVGKQIAGYMKCLGKALVACERTGVLSTPECTVEDGTVVAPADPRAKFAAAVARCDAKLDFDRKAPRGSTSLESYELIGCPGYGLGFVFSGMDQFQSFLLLLKPAMDDVVSSLGFVSGCDDALSCALAGKAIFDLIDGLGKCELACENDYKDRKGNGGPTDSETQCDGTGDANAQLCLDKAAERFRKKAEAWPLREAVISELTGLVDGLNDDLFNVAPNCN